MTEEQDIQTPAPPDGGGPGQGPVLTDSQRKELHGVVAKMIIAKEPEENIKKVIDHYTSTYGTPVAASAPIKASPDFSNPASFLPQVSPMADVYKGEVQGASQRMQAEAQKVDPAIVSILTDQEHQRRAAVLQSHVQERGDLAGANPRLQKALQGVLPKPQPVEIPAGDVAAMKQQAAQDPAVFGEILRRHAEMNPTKAGQIKADMYLLNSQKRAPGKEDKILANAEDIKNGHSDYNLWHPGGVEKPEGFFQSIVTGHKERNQEVNDYEFFQSHNDGDIIKKLNDDRAAYDPDEPVHTPSGFGGAVGAGLGGNAELLLKGGGAATLSTMLGGPEVAPYFGAAMTTPEMTARAFSNSLKTSYYQLVDQGADPAAALKTAKNQATIDAAKAGVQGALMTITGAKLGLKPTAGYQFTPQFKSIVTGLAKETGKFGKEVLATGLPNAAAAGALEFGSNVAANAQGIKRDLSHNVFEAAGGQLAMELALGGVLKLGGKASKVLLNNISKQPAGAVQSTLKDMESHGTITPIEGQTISDKIDEHRAVDEQIPAHVEDENARIKIADLIQHKSELESKLETLNKAYHPVIKNKIAAIDEQIQELSGLSVKEKAEGAAPAPKETEGDKLLTGMPDEIKNPPSQEAAPPVAEHGSGPAIIRNVKLKSDAIQEPSASGVLQHPQEGVGETGSERQRLEPGEQGEGAAEARGEAGEAPGEEKVGGKEPPPFKMWDLPFEAERADLHGITHEETEHTRQDLGLGGEPYESTRRTDVELNKTADDAIKKGYNVDELIGKMEGGHNPSDVENTILKKYKAYLSEKIRVNPSDENLAMMRRFSKATNLAGTLAGRGLRSRQGLELNDGSLEDFFSKDMDAAGTETLTPEHKEQIIKEHDNISSAEQAYKDKIAQLEAENAKMRAAKEVGKVSKGPAKKGKSDYSKERSDIVSSMKEKLRKARGETNITIVPYAKELIAIAPDVAKLVKSYASEGAAKLEDIIASVKEHLVEVIPQITDKDIHNIIAGEYNEKKSQSDLQQRLRDLRMQAQLTNKLEELENGTHVKNQRQQLAHNREVEQLREKIKDYQRREKESNKFYKDTVGKTPLENYKERTRKEISDIEGKLKAGDYSKPVKKEPIKLDKEARDLQDQLISLKQEREKRLAQMEYDKRSLAYRAWKNTMEAVGIPRTIMASADLSAPLRQGAVATISHPVTAGKAAVEMMKSAVSQKNFDRWLYNLKESPLYPTIEESGLYVADPNSMNLTAREEAFMSHAAEKIPLIGKVVAGSERAYTAYLNKMRVDLFSQAVDAFAAEGKTIQNSPELYKGMANFINAATGRGSLPEAIKSAAPLMNNLFFSPRLIASRLQLLNPIYYTKLPKQVRMMAIKDMAKFIGVGTAVVSLAKLAGADVEEDPRSPDFGKIKVGNTRWDVWGGFQQYIRVAAQELNGNTKSSTTGNIVPLTGTTHVDDFGNTKTTKPRKTRADVALTFLRGKLAPVPGAIWDAAAGRDVVGKPFDPAQKAMELFTPMIVNDVSEAWKDQGYKSLFTVGLPSALGVGISTYGRDNKNKANDVP